MAPFFANVQHGNTALSLAASRGHSKVVEELLKGPRIDVDGQNVVCYRIATWFCIGAVG